MKRIFAAVAVAAAVVGFGIPVASAEPAVVIKNDGQCGMPGSDAAGNLIFGGVGTIATEVENGNKVTIKCKGQPIENDSGRGQSFNGFLCGIIATDGISFFITDDSHATVSASVDRRDDVHV